MLNLQILKSAESAHFEKCWFRKVWNVLTWQILRIAKLANLKLLTFQNFNSNGSSNFEKCSIGKFWKVLNSNPAFYWSTDMTSPNAKLVPFMKHLCHLIITCHLYINISYIALKSNNVTVQTFLFVKVSAQV